MNSNSEKRASEDRRHGDRRIEETLARRASERAALAATIPDCLTEAEEAEEAEYLDRMHRAQQNSWRARGWTPAVY